MLMLKLVLRDSLRLLCMHAPLIAHVGENPFPKVVTFNDSCPGDSDNYDSW